MLLNFYNYLRGVISIILEFSLHEAIKIVQREYFLLRFTKMNVLIFHKKIGCMSISLLNF